jgi:hypothetical protein
MKSSKPVESQSMCEELLENIYSKSTLSDIRDLLLSFKEKNVRAPQIAHFLMNAVRINQAKPKNEAWPEDIEDKIFDVLDMVLGLMSDSFTVWQSACKWGPARPILYLDKLCPVCNTGILGFRRLNDTKKIVIACHECESIWTNPDNITCENARHVSAPDFGVLELGASIYGDNAAWATAEEIRMHGWKEYISGEENPVY